MNETKTCTKCGRTKSPGEFEKNKRGKDGLCPHCKKCRREYRRNWRLANPTYGKDHRKTGHIWEHGEGRFVRALIRARTKSKKDGVRECAATPEEVKAAFTGWCDICRTIETEHDQKLQISHCPETGRFHGWVCPSCAYVLHKVGYSREELLSMARFLKAEEDAHVFS